MKILLLNTFGSYGGAAKATLRLKSVLEKSGHDVKLGILKGEEGVNSFKLQRNLIDRLNDQIKFILERIEVLFVLRDRKHLYKFSTGSFGFDLTKTVEFNDADIVHMHWINFGLLDILEIKEMAKLKPIVWTFHDMWAFTGGCHYAMDCSNFERACENCFYLKPNSNKAYTILQRKKIEWSGAKMNIITCSNWLARQAQRSAVFQNGNIQVVGNTLDFEIFKPRDKKSLRRKYGLSESGYFVIYGAMDHQDERKGVIYLEQAISQIKQDLTDLHLLSFGSSNSNDVGTKYFGSIEDEQTLSEIYNCADVFVLPSVQDNLPNTVMEALSCGVPVVTFDSGGVSDMVSHLKNGYIADQVNSDSLAAGIRYFSNVEILETASLNARSSMLEKFSNELIAQRHLEIYEKAIGDF